MPSPYVSEKRFIELWREHGCARGVADAIGCSVRAVYDRRSRLTKRGYDLPVTVVEPGYETRSARYDDRWTWQREAQIEVPNGAVVVSSDHHYWPDEVSVAHKALLVVIRKVKPRVKILNGDVFDGVSVSRHPPFGWSNRPSVRDEIEACQERVHEIELALPKGCETYWNIGNHCLRFERVLATHTSEFSGFEGTRLQDHFPNWSMQWSTLINPKSHIPCMVKHKEAGGVHAAYNNTMKGGVHFVTGHTHILEAKPWTDYRGRRWGVQTGTISDLDAPAFEYTENGPPKGARSGFVVLHFENGDLIHVELCEVDHGVARFRGEIVAEREAA